jgi:hypothetical protein
MTFEIIGKISDIQTIAIGNKIREINRLKKIYGKGRWRKMKGIATIRLSNKIVINAELHWYEAGGIGKKEFKIKNIF